MTEVRLFGTCLAEEFFPSVVGATASILENLKIKVRPMGRAFCCGQAPFNEGLRDEAAAIRPWVFELSQFLVNVLKVKYLGARYEHTVAYHPACHLVRELHVVDEPRALLGSVAGLKLVDFRNPEECCGFGGMFSVKFPHISTAMVEDKIIRIKESGAERVVANDCGCLMQIGGAMHRQGLPIATLHLAEVLASR